MATPTDLIQQLYVAYYNRPADVAGLSFYVNAYNNGATIDAISKSFNTAPEYTAAYAGKSADAIVNTVYTNLFGRGADSEGLNFWGPKIASGAITTADLVKAITAGALNADGTPNADGAVFNNKVAAAVAFTTEIGTAGNEAERVAYADGSAATLAAAKAFIGGVTTDASLTTAIAGVHAAAQAIVAATVPVVNTTLTTGVDTIVGGAGNDTISASDTTFTGLDSIDGGAGVNTLNISDVAGSIDLSLATVKNFQKASVQSTAGLAGNAGDVSGWTGLTNATFSLKGGAAAQTITAATTTALNIVNTGTVAGGVTVVGSGGALVINEKTNGAVLVGNAAPSAADANALTSATVTGAASTVTISDNSGTNGAIGSTLTTVSVSDATGAIALNGKGIVNVTAVDLAANLTITNATAGHTQSLTLNGATAGTVKDTAATTVAINSTGASNSGITVDLNAVGTTLTVSGEKSLSAAIAGAGALTAFTSTNTAGVNISSTFAATTAVTTGAGNDTLVLATAYNKAATTGAGDDSVTLGGAFGANGSLDAGAGTDTLVLTEALAANDSLSADGTFAGLISNFERLSLTTVTGSKTVDLAQLDAINYVTTTAATALTLDNMAANGTVVLTAATNVVTVNESGAAAATNDVLNVIVKQTGDTAFGTVNASNVETLNVTSTDSNSTVAGTTDHTLTIVDTAAKTIVVTGNAHLTLTQASTALTSISAAGMTVSAATTGADTAGLNFISGALAAAATVTGSSGVDSLNFTAATKAVTLNGGTGGTAGNAGDTLIGGSFADTITFSGLGNAVLTGNGGADTITGSTGSDTITGGAAGDTLKGGGGNDTFVYTAVTDSAPGTFDTIVDFVAKTATANGDVIQLAAAMFGGAATTVNVSVVSNGSLALAALGAAAHTTNLINVALDSSTGTLYIDGQGVSGDHIPDGTADMAIVLTGVTTLTASAFTIV